MSRARKSIQTSSPERTSRGIPDKNERDLGERLFAVSTGVRSDVDSQIKP
jgi:hypothetical protein